MSALKFEDDEPKTTVRRPKQQPKPENGFTQPTKVQSEGVKSKNLEGLVPKPRKVLDGDLTDQLNILKSSTATEQQKVNALIAISSIFQNQGDSPTLTQQDAKNAITTINEQIFTVSDQTKALLTNGLNSIKTIFLSSVCKGQGDMGNDFLEATFTKLFNMASISKDENVKAAALDALGSIVLTQGFYLTNENQSELTQLACNYAADKNVDLLTRISALSVLGNLLEFASDVVGFNSMPKALPVVCNILGDSQDDISLRKNALNLVSDVFYRDSSPLTEDNISSALEAVLNYAKQVSSQEQYQPEYLLQLIAVRNATNAMIDFSPVISYVKSIIDGDADAGVKKNAVQCLNFLLYGCSDSQFDMVVSTANAISQNSVYSADLRNAAGGVVANACFVKPELLRSKYQFLKIDEMTAEKMVANSPQWASRGKPNMLVSIDYVSVKLGANDFETMYVLAATNRGHIIETLFQDANLTCFGYYPIEILQHMFDDRDKLTGKQVMYIVNSKHNWNGTPFASYIDPNYLSKFDVRIIEPGTTDKLVELTNSTMERLGIKSKYVDPLGPKVNFFCVNGHAGPVSIQLKNIFRPGSQNEAEQNLILAGASVSPDELKRIMLLKTGESFAVSKSKFMVRKETNGMISLYKISTPQEISEKRTKLKKINDGSSDYIWASDKAILKEIEPYVSGGNICSTPLARVAEAKNEFARAMKIAPSTLKDSDFAILSTLREGQQTGFSVSGFECYVFVKNGVINISGQAQGVLDACSTAGDATSIPGYDMNIAETIAKYLKIKVWGAQAPAAPGNIEYVQRTDGSWYISNVTMLGSPSTSYDYSSTAYLPTNSLSVQRTSDGSRISWQAQNATNTQYYEVERSTDGKEFDKVGKVAVSGDDTYSFVDNAAPSGKIFYRIKQVNMDLVGTDGSMAYTYAFSPQTEVGSTTGVREETPKTFVLNQNYPNPFNASTTISYSLPKQENVTLKIYDMIGREVRVLAENELQQAGEHKVNFEALGLASGVYFYEIVAGEEREKKKMVLLK